MAQSPSESFAKILAEQNKYAHQILSIKSHVIQTLEYSPQHYVLIGVPPTTQNASVERVLDYAWKKNKTYSMEEVTDPKLGLVTYTNIWDGKKAYSIIHHGDDGKEYTYGSSGVKIGHGLEHSPLDFYCYKNRPIIDLIRSSPARVETQMNDNRFGKLWVVSTQLIQKDQIRQLKFWFAEKYGMAAVKVEEDVTLSSRISTKIAMEASGLQNNNNVWLATGATVWKTIGSPSNNTLDYKMSLRYSRVELNNIPDVFFSPNIPTGGTIDDIDEKKRYLMNSSGQWERIKSPFDNLPKKASNRPMIRINPFSILFIVSAISTAFLIFIRSRQTNIKLIQKSKR